jgi:predicted acetyltransferase
MHGGKRQALVNQMTATNPTVTLERASRADAATLANLSQLYIHDLSAIFPNVELGQDGLFRYDHLPLYWSQPDDRFPFLIRSQGKLAGFALVTRGSPAEDDPNVLDIAEFFVARRFRRAGVGREAARLLWTALPGKWTVRVSEGNDGALRFWEPVVHGLVSDAKVTLLPGDPNAWRVYSFDSGSLNPLSRT